MGEPTCPFEKHLDKSTITLLFFSIIYIIMPKNTKRVIRKNKNNYSKKQKGVL